MQNLSFQTTQNAPLKNLAEPAKKNDTNAESFVAGDANTPFQMMLSKQLKAQTKQGNGEHVAVENNSKSKPNNAKTGNNSVNELVDDKADADSVINLSVATSGLIEVDVRTSLAAKEAVDNKPENNKPEDASIASVDTSALTLALIAQPVTIEKLQVTTSVSSSNAVSQTPSKLETATQSQQSVVAELSDSLEQIKATHSTIKDGISSNAAWPATNEESTRLKSNGVKDLISRDVVVKDMTIPANFQPAVQINAAMPMQQAGSINTINAYPGKAGWDQAISQKVLWMVGASEQSATLILNPPDLGPLQVVINVNNDMVDTTFVSDNPEVRQALQDGMSNLRDKMSESGIQLGQANVNSGRQPQQEFQQATQNRPTSHHNNAQALPAEKTSSVNTVVRTMNGLVDTFV